MGVHDQKKRLLLINPANPVRSAVRNAFATQYPPLGLAIIAALTPGSWKIRLIDETFQPFRYREADLVGLTALTGTIARAYEIARMYRDHNVPVVLGGIHASMMPEEALKHADAVVIGEAETVWPEVLEDFKSGTLKRIYRGSYSDLSRQPIPRHDLFHPRYLFHGVQTTRGCPFDCDFCTVTAFNGKRFRLRPVEEVLDELETIQGDNRSLIFVDDNLIGIGKNNQERAVLLFKGMVERKIKINWFTQTSVEIAENDEVLKWAAKSGCKMLYIGIESENPEALKSVNKAVNLKRGPKNYRRVFRKIHKHGIAVLGSFIFGLESDTRRDLLRRAWFTVFSNVDCYQANVLTPFPGTRLFDRMVEQERILRNGFPDEWSHYHAFDITFRHPLIPPVEFARTMTKAWRISYHPLVMLLGFFRTWINTRRLTPALWAYSSNKACREIVFEKKLSVWPETEVKKNLK